MGLCGYVAMDSFNLRPYATPQTEAVYDLGFALPLQEPSFRVIPSEGDPLVHRKKSGVP